MSRLDKIKARADAATKGPWLQDGPWWTDDGGPEPTALPCVVDVDRALVVFPPDATDVGMKRPEDRAANMAFIAAAREDVPWLIERIGELIGAICWDTTCLNCSSLLDSNYDQYMRAEIAEAEVERLTDLCDEFRKREESQDCIRERLTAEVESLERWKFEACEVMSGLRELGKALGLGLGVQITGPAALAEVARLTAERDALAAQVARVEEVLDHWRTVDEGNAAYAERIGERSRFADGLASRADALRAALAGSEADTSDTQSTDQEDQS